MATIKMGGGPGGTVQGNWGVYQPGTDGFYTVDTRDVPQLLEAGLVFLSNPGASYTTPITPRAGTSGRIIASATMSNGALSIANQPDIGRQLNVVLGNPTTPGISAGSVTLGYLASDGQVHSDVYSLPAVPTPGTITLSTSRPVVKLNTAFVSALAGGASPNVRVDDANLFGLPSDANAQDFVVNQEFDGGTNQTSPGTASTSCIGAASVVNTPTGSSTLSFLYSYVAPNI